LFVAGTDTGVGKTTVGSGLLRLAIQRGRRPIPFKPVETGCAPDPLDARLLWEAAGRPVRLDEVCPFALELPAAPAAAAALVGLRLDVADLARRGLALADRGDFLLVEGAGGLLAPYAGAITNADLAAGVGLPVLVVGRTALGTINHVALTVAELRRRGLPLAGIILVQHDPVPGPHESANGDLIADLIGERPIGTLRHLSTADAANPDRVATALAEDVPEPVLNRLLAVAS
jgi:dethiobiotin synthetase